MNWDWDKLQEKRQRQNWGNSNNNSNNNNNNNKNDEEPPFGSGSGNGGGKGPDYEKFSDAFKRLPHLSAPAAGSKTWYTTLGGSEPTTLKELSTALGKETIDAFNPGESRGRATSHSLS